MSTCTHCGRSIDSHDRHVRFRLPDPVLGLPEYAQLRMDGRLANALPGWEVFGVPVSLAVTDPEATPYCVASSDEELRSVLTSEWDHEPVLTRLPD